MHKFSEVSLLNGLYFLLIFALMVQLRDDLSTNFVELDRCCVRSYLSADQVCVKYMEGIDMSVRKEPKYIQWKANAAHINNKVEQFVGFIDSIRSELISATAGSGPGIPTRSALFRSKSITKRLLNKERVALISKKVMVVHGELVGVTDVRDRAYFPLLLSRYLWTHKSPEQFILEDNLSQLPVGSVLALLSQLKLDAKISEATVLNYCFEKTTGGCCGYLHRIVVGIFPERFYLIAGQHRFRAKIVVADLRAPVLVTLKGSRVLEAWTDDVANVLRPVSDNVGEKLFVYGTSARDPKSRKWLRLHGKLDYLVGRPSVGILADKMQVFYAGVNHHLAIKATDFSSADLQVAVQGADASIRQVGSDYVLTARDTGVCKVLVKSPDYKFPMEFTYHVKPCPDPIPVLGPIGKRNFDAGEFQQLDSLTAQLPEFDFAQDCTIVGFNLTKVGKRVDPIEVPNNSGRFNSETKGLIQSAAVGDHYLFTDIQARCAGDKASRTIGSLCVVIR